MTTPPQALKNIDLERTDAIVKRHLRTQYLEHPTRGPYVKSGDLYEDLADEIDDRFSVELFGMFCESRRYLEKWSHGYRGSYRYRIDDDVF